MNDQRRGGPPPQGGAQDLDETLPSDIDPRELMAAVEAYDERPSHRGLRPISMDELDFDEDETSEEATMQLDLAALRLGLERPAEEPEAPPVSRPTSHPTLPVTPNTLRTLAIKGERPEVDALAHEDRTMEADLSLLSQGMMAFTGGAAAPRKAPQGPSSRPGRATPTPRRSGGEGDSTVEADLSTLSRQMMALHFGDGDMDEEEVQERQTRRVEMMDLARHLTETLHREQARPQEQITAELEIIAVEVAADVAASRTMSPEPTTVRGNVRQIADALAFRLALDERNAQLDPDSRRAMTALAFDLANQLEAETEAMSGADQPRRYHNDPTQEVTADQIVDAVSALQAAGLATPEMMARMRANQPDTQKLISVASPDATHQDHGAGATAAALLDGFAAQDAAAQSASTIQDDNRLAALDEARRRMEEAAMALPTDGMIAGRVEPDTLDESPGLEATTRMPDPSTLPLSAPAEAETPPMAVAPAPPTARKRSNKPFIIIAVGLILLIMALAAVAAALFVFKSPTPV